MLNLHQMSPVQQTTLAKIPNISLLNLVISSNISSASAHAIILCEVKGVRILVIELLNSLCHFQRKGCSLCWRGHRFKVHNNICIFHETLLTSVENPIQICGTYMPCRGTKYAPKYIKIITNSIPCKMFRQRSTLVERCWDLVEDKPLFCVI